MPFLLMMCLISANQEPRGSYLVRTAALLELCRADLPAMSSLAEQAAERLAKGRRLWAAGSPALVSEVCGRAGGLMMIRPLPSGELACGDVVLFFAGEGAERPAANGDGLVISFGAGGSLPDHALEAGVSSTVGMAASAWVFTGELIAALTRLSKMPVIYESIGAYGGFSRISEFKNGEVAWHENHSVKPVAAGVMGRAYIDSVRAMLRRIEKEHRRDLDKVGEWARSARSGGKRLYMYSMGHMFPDEIAKSDIGKLFRSGVWNAGFRNPRPDDEWRRGDLVVHVGYQHPPDDLLRRARTVGARAVYVCIVSHRDFTRDANVVRIDPMWDWADACVSLEGYDIPVLPVSGVINSAIAWEIRRVTLLPAS